MTLSIQSIPTAELVEHVVRKGSWAVGIEGREMGGVRKIGLVSLIWMCWPEQVEGSGWMLMRHMLLLK